MKGSSNESGFSAIWVALCLLFLLAATALAVDVSGFYETARTDQTTADLACLAGIPSMPENPAVARASAAENAQQNFPSLATATPSTSGNTLTLSDAFGNSVAITAPFGADNNKMQVSVTETDQATFGRVIGASDVPITQVAYCKVFAGGSGNVPFAGMPGGWTGGLQAPNPCGTNSGNCGQLYIPNAAVNGNGGPVFEENVAEGVDRILTPGLYPALVNCASTPPGAPCNVVQTDPGVNAGTLGDGFLQRLSDTAGSSQTFTRSGSSYDADTVAQILGSTPAALPAQPGAWQDWIHGPWGTADVSNHRWWNDVIAKCDSPRLISFPIVSEEMDWSDARYQAGDPYPQWPNGGSKDMRVIGIYTAILENPNDSDDFFGNGSLKFADSTIIWFGPNARCVGPDGSTTPFTTGSIKTYRLVDAAA